MRSIPQDAVNGIQALERQRNMLIEQLALADEYAQSTLNVCTEAYLYWESVASEYRGELNRLNFVLSHCGYTGEIK